MYVSQIIMIYNLEFKKREKEKGREEEEGRKMTVIYRKAGPSGG